MKATTPNKVLTSSELINEILTSLSIHTRKIQSSRYVPHMPEFSYRHQDFYGFDIEEVRSDGTLIEWESDLDVLVAIFSPLILVEKSVVKLQKQ